MVEFDFDFPPTLIQGTARRVVAERVLLVEFFEQNLGQASQRVATPGKQAKRTPPGDTGQPRQHVMVDVIPRATAGLGVIVVITWFLVRFISQGEQSFIRQRRMAGEEVDQTTADAIDKLLRISVIITSTLVVLQTLGYSISGVLAFGGVGGIALGFAAKDLLANFFGGLMVYLDRPFSVGD